MTQGPIPEVLKNYMDVSVGGPPWGWGRERCWDQWIWVKVSGSQRPVLPAASWVVRGRGRRSAPPFLWAPRPPHLIEALPPASFPALHPGPGPAGGEKVGGSGLTTSPRSLPRTTNHQLRAGLSSSWWPARAWGAGGGGGALRQSRQLRALGMAWRSPESGGGLGGVPELGSRGPDCPHVTDRSCPSARGQLWASSGPLSSSLGSSQPLSRLCSVWRKRLGIGALRKPHSKLGQGHCGPSSRDRSCAPACTPGASQATSSLRSHPESRGASRLLLYGLRSTWGWDGWPCPLSWLVPRPCQEAVTSQACDQAGGGGLSAWGLADQC